MRKVYRTKHNVDYWDLRWRNAEDDEDEFSNLDTYPIKFAEMVACEPPKLNLELGCGLGRVVKHYLGQGKKIVGMEYNLYALQKIKQKFPETMLVQGDAVHLPFKSGTFDSLMAFGLYHNLEFSCEEAIRESVRCLKSGGRFAASARLDNMETRLIDWITKRRSRGLANKFHKWCVTSNEFKDMFERQGLIVDNIDTFSNVPFLFKFRFFRCKSLRTFDEKKARSMGFELNLFGKAIYSFFKKFFPGSFDNVVVVVGHKPPKDEVC